MATITDLNFQVILKGQTEFDKQLQAVEKRAEQFNMTVSDYLALTKAKGGAKNIKEITEALREATAAQKELNDAVKKSPAEKITIRHRDAVTATNAKLYDTARILRTVGTLTGGAFSIYGLRRFLSTLIEVTGQFEVQKMALRTMLQDIDAADKIFQDLYRFSSDSTYRFSELAKYSKQLAAFNIGKDSLLETTKMLGDVASGVGVSMDRIILAYGHVKSSGFLRGIQLRSFAQNGVPVLDELAKMFSELEHRAVSLGEVFDKMTRREIPFEMVEQAFKNMTSEGGKFYKMQEVLSKTLAGQINILKGRWENLMYAIGQSQEGLLKGTVSSISNLIANYEEFGKVVRQAVLALGIYKATLIGIELRTNTFALANHKVLKSLVNIGKWIATNPYAILAAAIAAVTFAVVRSVTALSEQEKQQKNLNKAVADYNSAVTDETALLDHLFGKLKNATAGTKEYDDAKKQILQRYDSYLTAIDKENLAIGNSVLVYQNLAEAIKNANKEKFREQAISDISATNQASLSSIQSRLQGLLDYRGGKFGRAFFGDNEQQIIADFVYGRGVESLNDLPDELKKKINGQVRGFGNSLGYELNKLREEAKTAAEAMDAALKDVDTKFNNIFGKPEGGNKSSRVVYDVNKIVEGIKKDDKEIADLVKKAATVGLVVDPENKIDEKAQLEQLRAGRAEQAKLYKDIMGVDYDSAVKAAAKKDKADQKEEMAEIRAEIQLLNKRASVIQKYKDVYDSLRPYLNEEQTTSALEHLFGIKFQSTDFDTQLDRLIVKLAELGDEGQQAAESLRASLGKDTAQDLKKALEAQDKAAEMLSDYLKKDFGIEGEGVAAQISKILVDLTNKNIKADDKLADFIKTLDKTEIAEKLEVLSKNSPEFAAVRGVLGDKAMDDIVDTYWTKWRKEQIDAWKKQMELEKEANKKMSNEQIVGKADDLFKMMTGGLDLTNWNDKTLNQLRDIRTVLASLTIPQDILDLMDEETQKRFIEAFNLLKENNLKKGNKVFSEKSIAAAKRLSSALFGIGDAFTHAGEVLNNDVLTGMGKMVSVAEQVADAIGENESLMKSLTSSTDELQESGSDLAKTADWITMIVKLVLIVINQVVDVLGQAEAETLALKRAAVEAREALFNQNMADGVESVFGSNLTRQIRNANTELDKLRANMRMMSGGATLSKMASQHALFKKSGLFNMGHTPFTLNDAAYAAGLSVIDEKYGILNKDLLEIILNNYNLEESSRIWLESALTDVENYIEAMDTLKDVMGDVMGNIAESAADTIVDTWVEAGNAALDYADILDDVAKSYAKMLIQSAILDDVLNEDEVNRVLALFARGDHKEAMAAIAGDMEKIADMEPLFASILEAFDPYFNRDGSDNTLANGIKGITEDTANLLASYLNAIRADVAMMRSLAQNGWGKVDGIAAAIEVLPTLNDYVAQIEAHNANIEANTHQILVELQGVIVNEGSGRGFRSYPS